MTQTDVTSFRISALSTWAIGVLVTSVLVGGVFVLRAPDPTPQPLPFDMVRVTPKGMAPIMMQTHEITARDWNLCHAEGGCTLTQRPPKQGADYPATGLSYIDAQEYITWINAKTGRALRLPRSAEWYAIASEVLPAAPDPIFTDPSLTWASTYITESNRVGRRLRPTGSFATTADGIADLDGNVWEWTADCYAGTGSAPDDKRCPAFIMGGEHEAVMSYLVRDPARGGCAVGAPPAHLGMRLVEDL